MPIKSLLVLYSYHRKNTEAVAKVLAQVLGAKIVTPREVNAAELAGYDLVGDRGTHTLSCGARHRGVGSLFR